jgi:hypothetical protein
MSLRNALSTFRTVTKVSSFVVVTLLLKGGHVDAYIPYGEDLFDYDVNSLYPFVMALNLMPGGEPVWHKNLEGEDDEHLFGFVEAVVECPKDLNKPFLPYQNEKGILLFPMGKFVGVYLTEELKRTSTESGAGSALPRSRSRDYRNRKRRSTTFIPTQELNSTHAYCYWGLLTHVFPAAGRL